MKTDKTCSKPTRVNAYNRIGGCITFSYIPESYEIKCGGPYVASVYYSDSNCQSISSVSYYSPADYCSNYGYIGTREEADVWRTEIRNFLFFQE